MSEKDIGFIKDYFLDMVKAIGNISRDDIDRAIGILFEAWKNNKQVFACGNGGSASTATHFVCDISKTTIVEGKKRFRAMGLNDNIPLVSAITNDEGFVNLFYEQLVSHFRKGDVLVCFSVHGGVGQDKAGLWSQNLLKALKYAQDSGGKVIGFSGFDGGALQKMADACVIVPADSTPQVESFHLALEHLICNCLKEKIEGAKDGEK